jgi:thioredoxin-related protein
MLVPFILIVVGCASPSGKLGTPTTVLRHYQFSELDSLMSEEQRPVVVFLHTDWCKYCKNMEQTTFQNQQVIELLNNRFYFISFNGEQQEDVVFRNHLFRYQPTGRNTGTHELASALGSMEGVLSYPALVILNPEYELVFQHNAFIEAKSLTAILRSGSN